MVEMHMVKMNIFVKFLGNLINSSEDRVQKKLEQQLKKYTWSEAHESL